SSDDHAVAAPASGSTEPPAVCLRQSWASGRIRSDEADPGRQTDRSGDSCSAAAACSVVTPAARPATAACPGAAAAACPATAACPVATAAARPATAACPVAAATACPVIEACPVAA